MKLNQIMEILKDLDQNDWYVAKETIIVYKDDVNLRINGIGQTNKFEEAWAINHPDSNACMIEYEIFYGATFIESKTLIAVDGFRAYLPMPKINTSIIEREDYLFAKLITGNERLDEYIERSNLTVS